jgi:hypothetical protein
MMVNFMDVRGWLHMPHARGLVVAACIGPVLAMDLFQYLSRDEQILLRAPVALRAALYLAGLYAFLLFGRFESNAFIYFQF